MNNILKTNKLLFIVIGCGGVGGNLVRDLPKLLIGMEDKSLMMLIDGDKVEKKNLVRQPYQEQDIDDNKARVLSRKINTFYNLRTLFYDKYLLSSELDDICKKHSDYIPVFLGCVDNDKTRKIIEDNFKLQNTAIYIDGANTVNDGNVYVVGIFNGEIIGKLRSDVYILEDDINPGELSCEDLVSKGNTQILITNEKIAMTILEHVYSLITSNLNVGVTVIERFKILHY